MVAASLLDGSTGSQDGGVSCMLIAAQVSTDRRHGRDRGQIGGDTYVSDADVLQPDNPQTPPKTWLVQPQELPGGAASDLDVAAANGLLKS